MGSSYGEQSDRERRMNFNTLDLEELVEEANTHILLRGNVNRNNSLKAFKKKRANKTELLDDGVQAVVRSH